MAKVIYMCEKIGRRNISDFDEKKLDIEPDWESIIERGFWIYLHTRAFADSISISKGTTSTSLSQRGKLWKVEKFFLLLGEKCCSSKSRHRLAETLGILDLYVAARFSKITIENNNWLNFKNIYLSMFLELVSRVWHSRTVWHK